MLGKTWAAVLTRTIKKCNLFKNIIKILGYIVSREYFKPDPQKITKKNYIRLENIRSFDPS